MAAIGGGRRTQTAQRAESPTAHTASGLPADAAYYYYSEGETMKGEHRDGSRDVHLGLEAAPRGTWTSAGLVTDYFGIADRIHRVPVRWQARRARGITSRVVALRAKLRQLQADFGVTVYGPERYGV
jgi:hypothetical protein